MAAPAGSDETRHRAENQPAWLRLLLASQDEPRVMRRIPPRPLCAACGGSGKRKLAETGGQPAPCPRCKGSGSEPTPIPRP
jgi:hypothetical protein